MVPFTLPENAVLISTLAPAADAAGRTGNYVAMKTLLKAFVVFNINQGNAATIALSISKATAVAGTGATPSATITNIFASEDQAASHQFTASQAASFTTSAAVKNKVVVLEINPGTLGDGYDCFAPVTGASNAANITSAMVYGIPRVGGATIPSVLVD